MFASRMQLDCGDLAAYLRIVKNWVCLAQKSVEAEGSIGGFIFGDINIWGDLFLIWFSILFCFPLISYSDAYYTINGWNVKIFLLGLLMFF